MSSYYTGDPSKEGTLEWEVNKTKEKKLDYKIIAAQLNFLIDRTNPNIKLLLPDYLPRASASER